VIGMNRRSALLAAALAAAVVVLVLVAVREPAPPEPAAEPTTGYRVVLVAVDGLDGYLVTRYTQEGALPAISRFLRRAATAEIAADVPPLPLVGWTRLATGRSLSEAQMEAVAPPGGRLFSLPLDLALAVREAGGRTVAVGWPGTWPVTGDDSNVVAPYVPAAGSHASALAPALFGEAPGQTTPELAPLVADAVSRSRTELESEMGRLIGPGAPRPDAAWGEALVAARWSLLADMTTVEVAAKLIAREEPHLALVYLGGLDAACHRFLPPAMPAYFASLPPGSDGYSQVLGGYYQFVDSALERLQRLCDERTLIVVCSAYGMHPTRPDEPPSASHAEGPPGALILHGRDVVSTPVPLQMSTLDVAPTILALLGVPIPSDMEGRIVAEALPSGLLERFPVAYVKPPRRASTPTPADAELEAEMDGLVTARLGELRADRTTTARP
jgi:hypothetical protein